MSLRPIDTGAVPLSGPRVALALGGGAARGIGHIPVLEALDELGVTPVAIAGTSIGAILGACYAAGLTGREIREHCLALFGDTRIEPFRRIYSARSLKTLISPRTSAMFDGVTLFEILLPEAVRRDFSALKIPFCAIATDFYAIEQVILDHGPIIPAITASSALPGVFRPVVIGEQVLIDGGFVNPTPYDVVQRGADITIAIDVTGATVRGPGRPVPSSIDAWIGAAQITLHSITREKLRSVQPDILLRPAVGPYGAFDFYKIREILEISAPIKEELKRALGAKLDALGK